MDEREKLIKILSKIPKEILINCYKQLTDCISRSKLPLRDYQKKVVKFIMEPTNSSLLVVWATGLGKTLTALTATQCYLDKYPNNKVVIISPKTLTENFPNEMIKYGGVIDPKKYEFFSFTKFSSINKNDSYSCENNMVIIDEAHNLRNMTQRYESVYNCVKNSRKLLLLTATPFINKLSDFVSLITLLYRNKHILADTKQKIPKIIKPTDEVKTYKSLSTLLKNKVIFQDDKSSVDYPQVFVHDIVNLMSENYFNKYARALKVENEFGDDPETFFNGFRRAVNAVGADEYVNQKINSIMDIVKNGKQTLIYSNWLEAGVDVITRTLDNNFIKYGVISGEVTLTRTRMRIVDEFNSKEIQVLIITMAGAEGIDLRGTRQIIILDPPWNNAMFEQIIGRGIRYRSHEHLPLEERRVDVYRLILESKSKRIPSGDELLYDIIEKKKKIYEKVREILINASIK